MKIEQATWTPTGGWAELRPAPGIKPHFVLAFGSRHLIADPAALATVHARHPEAHLLASSTAGEIADTSIGDDTIVVTAVELEKTRLVATAVTTAGAAGSFASGVELGRRLNGPELSHVFVVSNGSVTNGAELARGLRSALPAGVLVTGGLAGDGTRFEQTLVGLDGTPASDCVAALGFYGSAFQSGFGISDDWAPFGPERVVTRSEGNRLYTLDGVSALGLYKIYLGDQAAGLPGAAMRFPLSLTTPDGTSSVVRTILAIDEAEQSMIFAGDIPVGSRVRFMHAPQEAIIDGAGVAADKLPREPQELVVCVSCVGRRVVLGQRTEEETELVRECVGPGPAITGFYSYGELAPVGGELECSLHNQTMTITSFREV